MNLTRPVTGVEFDGAARPPICKATLLALFERFPRNVIGATITTILGATPAITE
jgi:hypothetical protein